MERVSDRRRKCGTELDSEQVRRGDFQSRLNHIEELKKKKIDFQTVYQ